MAKYSKDLKLKVVQYYSNKCLFIIKHFSLRI